ncbi:MAG: gene transfer agent family protein [Pseudomonadota bacterium]
MSNPWAGEVTLVIDGASHVMKLTLGALAELEAEMDADTLVAMIARFEQGHVAARDVVALIVAGLRGGGWRGSKADLLSADIEGGPIAATRAAGELIKRAFAFDE